MKTQKPIFLLFFVLCLAVNALAQGPNESGTYYRNADGKQGAALKTALSDIISSHTALSYNALWTAFKTTDKRADGKVWDMYSNITNFVFGTDQVGNYQREGDVYNREHSFPKSWFSEGTPMYTDLVHLVPTDGYVNGMRSNNPFGETDGGAYKSANGFSKLGTCTYPGYTGKVFEPNDEYKGDFARIYFYMATCYEDRIASWNSDMLSNNKTTAYAPWAISMLLKWAENDPVSQKEIDRNNAVYGLQHNRNPFVDYPGLEQYIWGTKTTTAFSYDNYGGSTIVVPPGGDPDPDPDPNEGQDLPEGTLEFNRVSQESDLTIGSHYIIVCERSDDQGKALSVASGKVRSDVDVTISDGTITTEVNQSGKPYTLTLGGAANAYTLYDATGNVYLALTSSDNALHSVEQTTADGAFWTISITQGDTRIQNNGYTDRYLRYNASSPRFACYKDASNQMEVVLYKAKTNTSSVALPNADKEQLGVSVYSVSGTLLKKGVSQKEAFRGLGKGLYIINNRMYVVK